MDKPILLIGAGLGGLTAALALLKAGFPVRLYEQAPELGDVGAGITMWPNLTIVLEALGLREVMEERGFVPSDMGNRHFQTGELMNHRIVGTSGRERYGAPQYFMHRADMHEMLVEAVQAEDPDAILLDHTLIGFDQDENGVVATFANGEKVEGSAIVGCDGIHSVVRKTLFGEDSPHWTGIVAWRGLVPMELLPDDILTPQSATWPGPNHYFVRYPVRNRTMMNYVAFAAHNVPWAEESWRLQATVDEVLEQFEGWDSRVRTVIANTPPDRCFKWALHDRDPLDQWTVGRATLLGDAAHAALPFLGQGAAMAVEDGMVLARALQLEPDISAALLRYEAARKERTHWMQIASRENARRQFKDPEPLFKSGEAQEFNRIQEEFRLYNAATAPI